MNGVNFQLALLCGFLALLCLLQLVRIQRLEAEPRPTLRDYFIAHAPADPQKWFIPVMAVAHPLAPLPLDRETLSKEEIRELNALGEYFDTEDMTLPRVRQYAEACDEHKRLVRVWTRDFEKEILLQWPGAWADAQLAVRKA